MNLVLKNINETADAGAKKLYRDARVNDGTLVFYDFSNRGSLNNFDLKKGVLNLADNTSVSENIVSEKDIQTVREVPDLTQNKGLPMAGLGNEPSLYSSGIITKGVGKYLFNKQPNTLFLVWIKIDFDVESPRTGRIIRLGDTGGGYNISLLLPSSVNPNISMFLAGKSTLNNYTLSEGDIIQVAVEFVDNNTPNNFYINGELVDQGSVSSGGFSDVDEDVFAIGGITASEGQNNPATLYNIALHDLDVAGMTAEEVVRKDFDYVNGIGEFSSLPTKRPYSSL